MTQVSYLVGSYRLPLQLSVGIGPHPAFSGGLKSHCLVVFCLSAGRITSSCNSLNSFNASLCSLIKLLLGTLACLRIKKIELYLTVNAFKRTVLLVAAQLTGRTKLSFGSMPLVLYSPHGYLSCL